MAIHGLDLARGLDLSAGLGRAAQIAPEGVATIFGDRFRTWREVADRVARLSRGLADLGLERGDVAGVLSGNADHYLEVLQALVRAAAVSSPLNIRFAYPELRYCVEDSRMRILFFEQAFGTVAAQLKRECRSLERIICLDGPCDPWEADAEYEALIAASDPGPDRRLEADEVAAIAYTGGTTGRPKGVLLTATNIYCAVCSMLWTGWGEDGSSALHIAPMFHVSGWAATFVSTFLAGPQIFLPRFDPAEHLRLIEAHRPPSLVVGATMLQMLMDSPDFARRDLSSVRRIIYGMSAMPEALLRRAMQSFPDAGFVQCFGQTETCGAVTQLAPRDHVLEGPRSGLLRSAGRAHALAQVAILDENGTERPRGEVGEICVRSPQIMAGYLNKPEATAEVMRHGWLHTGDAGRMDQDGYVYVVDRLKDMIISGGENVYSAEVENAICSHPAVKMCAVVGLPDALWGERVHAIVTLREDAEATADEIVAHCRQLIAGYKCPRSVDLRRDDLPLTAANKIAKADLRREAQRILGPTA
jgi:acyl-CoA synthetase (AMP-forming)/AMP-acid ligase II